MAVHMSAVLGNEIFKTFARRRSYISFLAIAVIIPLVQVALKLQGDAVLSSLARGLGSDFLFRGNILNGYFVSYFVMNSLWIHIPFLITLGIGDQLAGEATAGTFRLMLIRPVSRARILFLKYCTTLLYTFAVVAFLALLSLGLGVLFFGTGDLFVPGKALTIVPAAEAFWRLCFAFALALWGMWTVASLTFLFSSLVENAIGPIFGTMAVIIVFYVISNIPFDLFSSIRPFLFTTYMNLWQKTLEVPIPWGEITASVAALGAFSVGFYLATWYIFLRKDILS
jgi:ABC-2 type transport system permease protein